MTITAPPAEQPEPSYPPAEPTRARPDRWFPVLAFLAVGGVVFAVSVLAHAYLPLLHRRHGLHRDWVHAFGWWDGWWYVGIARRGYNAFSLHRQSPVAFFPAFPLLMRFTGGVLGGPLQAGILLCLASGLGVAVVFHRWCVLKMGRDQARLAVLVLLLYPFAFYLMGAVYADALFLLATLCAFLALELDHPVLAGLAAAVATASRPVGLALVVGLWALAVQRKHGRRWRAADAGLLLAPFGLLVYCAFLEARFDRPLAFVDVAGAPGWGQTPGPRTWLKLHWFWAMSKPPYLNGQHLHMAGNAVATVVALALVPLVFRRFGWAYGLFALAAIGGAAISTKDFVGMGRYALAAFPCFAATGDALSRRPKLAAAVLGGCGALLLMLAQLHARGTIIS